VPEYDSAESKFTLDDSRDSFRIQKYFAEWEQVSIVNTPGLGMP